MEEWTIRNTSKEWHDFHLHQGDFQIVSVEGAAQEFDGYRDTAQLPSNSEVKISIPFTDPATVGKYVYHSHILDHEDAGMMAALALLPHATLGSRIAPGSDGQGTSGPRCS